MIEEILSKANLTKAYKQVVSNRGSAGVDKMKVTDLKPYLQKHWDALKPQIEKGLYLPQLVKGIEIPKPNGGKRLLGIPTVMDRMLQQAIQQVLSEVYEPEFSWFSFGFRPGKSAHQAVKQALLYINSGYQYIIDLDLKTFFDVVNHDILMSLLQRKVTDPVVMKLIRKFLQSGIMIDGIVHPRESGTPQGSPLSPLLSNIILNEFDKELAKRGLRFVRYADDCSIFVKSERAAKRVLTSITKFLEGKLKLKVNPEKTKICRPVKLELLGYGFTPTYQKGVKGQYQLVTGEKAFTKLKARIKEVTRKTSPKTFDDMIASLNSVIRGWVNYFHLSGMWAKLRDLEGWIKNRIRYFIWKKWKKPNRRMRAYIQLGRNKEDAYAWSRSRLGGWRIAQSPIMTSTVTNERLEQRGYQSILKLFGKLHYVPRTA
jgi:group II intron reverse transcriptase/maturase